MFMFNRQKNSKIFYFLLFMLKDYFFIKTHSDKGDENDTTFNQIGQ